MTAKENDTAPRCDSALSALFNTTWFLGLKLNSLHVQPNSVKDLKT